MSSNNAVVIPAGELAPLALPSFPPDQEQSNELLKKAQEAAISDQASYNAACGLLQTIKSLRKSVIEKLDPYRASAYKTYQLALGLLKEAEEPLEQAETSIKRVIARWDQEQQRIQQALIRQQEEESRRLAEEERLANAIAVEETGGSDEEVAAVLEIPVVPVRVTPPPTYQKAKGMSIPYRWSAEVTDIKALCRAIAEGTIAPHFVTPNTTDINKLASAQRELFNLPGCRAKRTPQVSQRGVR